MKRLATALATVAGLALASAASAAVVIDDGSSPNPTNHVVLANITAGVSVTSTQVLAKGDTAQYVYTALERLRFTDIALSGTDGKSGNALKTIKFGQNFPPSTGFPTIVVISGTTAFGGGSLPGGVLNAGDTLTIFWSNGNVGQVPVTASFSTTEVPLPAALPLLAGGLAALGIARRRKASAEA